MNIRCKFMVVEVVKQQDARVLRLAATNAKDGDNDDWSQWTPSGHFEIQVTSPGMFAQIDRANPGDFYYLDLIPIIPL